MSANDEETQALTEHEAVFGCYRHYQKPAYSVHTNEALYISMHDGVRIAMDVTLPSPLPADAKIPAILLTTRYWRAQKGDPVEQEDLFYVRHGYAFIRADERGTGASFGTWPQMWPRTTVADSVEMVDWIVTQPWSNGRVGAIGVSYPGTNAQMLAATNHPAVKAVVPKFIEFDVYPDILFPGGVLLETLVKSYGAHCKDLDSNRWVDPMMGDPSGTVKPVDTDPEEVLLNQAVAEHVATNPDFGESLMEVVYRDDPIGGIGVSIDDCSMHQLLEPIERSRVAMYGWGSWYDACTADTVIRRIMNFSNPQRAVIGAWNHGGDKNANQYRTADAPPVPSQLAQWLESLRFFDYHLKNIDTGVMEGDPVVYITMGEEGWKRAATWPLDNSELKRWYLDADGTLSALAPTSSDGALQFEVDFAASAGDTSKWHTEFNYGAVVYADRAGADARCLTYTSARLETDLEVTGYATVTLQVKSSHADGVFHVYLEDVFPNGEVKFITEGMLRALHRKVSPAQPPYRMLMPHHSYKRADALAMIPGEVCEIVIGLQPTSVLFRQGHRIRLAIAGHDNPTFARIPADDGKPVVIEVQCNQVHASWVELPVIDNS